ncbi:LacI family DNA-binding transcriptional regulator [Leisingera sp. ANG59]|uniref:LacI family DNA-binding transcriptional regulator n=1 Tax=Leisingera sp. ANG59 TaxID=2675221 RepID=UPI0015747CC6|nr:LacI family DNA-binding transcriptional regulator [Leisingera sp. ANG59]NSY40921.1 LacI family DNA-binding transcriptional regulator [Leisingera sp. ANG59]
MKKPTISDLAQAAGVSKTTVSHAFSGRRHVDPETRERIEKIAQEIGYRPNRAAQHLRTGRTGMIALASSMPFSVAAGPSRLGFLMEIAATAAVASLTRNMALCLIPPFQSGAQLDAITPDGVILVEPFQDDPLVQHFTGLGVPVVSVGRVPGREDIPHVDLNSGATARMVLEHLRASGATRIGLVTGEQRRNSYIETEAAYRAFCDEIGIEPACLQLNESGGEDLAAEAVASLLSRRGDIDALYVPVDAFASGAVTAAASKGLKIPQNIRLATRYDGLRAKLSRPPLTAVELHLEAIADLAVGLLMAAIDGEVAGLVSAPQPELVLRASTAS